MLKINTGDVFANVGQQRYRLLKSRQEIEAAMRSRPDHAFRRVLVEITNQCNSNCRGCGAATVKKADESTSLRYEALKRIVEQSEELGIIGIAITGGEPTLKIDMMTEFIAMMNGTLDLSKINTNCWWAYSEKSTKDYLSRIKKANLNGNRFLIPLISASIGQQQGTIPMENIVNFVRYFRDVFSPSEAQSGISSTYTMKEGSLLRTLEDKYVESTSTKFPYEDVGIVESPLRREGKGKEFGNEHFLFKQIHEMTKGVKCFVPKIWPYLGHSLFIDCKGNIYACHIFSMHQNYVLGNIYSENLHDAIKNMKTKPGFKELLEGGPAGLLELTRKIIPEIGKYLVSSVHEACEVMLGVLNDNLMLKQKNIKIFLGGNVRNPDGTYIGYKDFEQWRDLFISNLSKYPDVEYFTPASVPPGEAKTAIEKIELVSSDICIFYIAKESLLGGVMSKNELHLAKHYGKTVYLVDSAGKMDDMRWEGLARFGTLEEMKDQLNDRINDMRASKK